MSCNNNTPNINKTFIIEPLSLTGGSPTISACTSLYSNLIQSCSGDTTITMGTGLVTFNSSVNGINSFTANTIEANTYLSGGTNILDIVNGNDTFVTGGTFNDISDTLTLVRNDGANVVIGGLANYYVTGGAYSNDTGLITFDRNDTLSAFTIDLSTIDVNDTFVTGGTLVNTDLILNLNDGSSTSSIDLSGLEFTGNTSGTCISDIHVSNIHSCSPLRINPNDEGNVYFGSTSGVTIDVINGNMGIGTTTPTNIFEVVQNTENFKLDLDDTLGPEVVLSTPQTDKYSRLLISDGVNILSMGTLGFDWTGSTVYGNPGDSSIYSNTSANGVNIISAPGTGTEDYIRLYAGGNPSTSTASIHIDGSGSTKGNVGIGTETPQVELHVKGNSSILRLETTSSTNNNYIEFWDPTERKGFFGYVSTFNTDALFIRNEEHDADIIISTTNSGGTSSTAINIDGNQNVELPNGNLDVNGTLTIGKLGTGSPINNLGIDSIGNVVVGTTGDTDTNTFVTGGTLSTNDLILEKNNGVDVNPINLSGLVSGKTDLTLFNSHTGDTNNPHQTSFSGLTSTAHTHTLSEVTDFNTYSGSVQTQIDGKTDNTDFISHTGDTVIHFTKGDISLSEIGNSAHTHTLSEITDFNTYSGNVQTQLNGKVETILFNSHTGDTSNPHQTSFSGLTSTAHTHTISDVINLQTELDGKLSVSEFNTYSGDVQTQIDNKLETSIFNSYTGSVVDVFVSSGNANSVTQQLSFTNTTGGTFNVTNSAALFSDNDVNVTGGTYNPSNGCVTFTTNSGTTFDVCGFVTGITDTFVTGGTLSGTDLILERSNGIDVSGIDLSSLISGKLDITTFNTYTGDTQTILDSKTDNTDFTSHTGDTTIHYTKGSINLSDLGSSAHTHTISEVINLQSELNGKTDLTQFNTHTGDTSNPHQTSFSNLTSTAHTHTISEVVNLQTELDGKTDNTDFTTHTGDTTIHFTKSSINLSDLGITAHTHTLSEITDFNTYSGNVQTQLDTKIQNGVNSGGANEVFSGNSGTDLYFRTISGGSNTTISTIDDIIRVDVSVPVDTNTFVTGFTYDDINTFTISRNNGLGDLTSTISVLSGITYYGDGSNLSGISSSDFYVTGGTFSSETLTLDRNDGGSVTVTGFTSPLWSSNVNGIHYNSGNVGIGMSASSVNTKLQIEYDDALPERAFRIKNTNDGSQYNFRSVLIGGENLLRIDSDNTGISPLVVSSANKVGIGTNALVPEATLHIYSTSGSQPIVLVEDEANPDATPFIIDIDGNVGIGTGTPTEKLDISGNTKISGTLNIGTLGTGTSVNNLGIDGNGNVVSGTTGGGTPTLNDGEIFVGDTGNTAQSVAMTGDVNIDNTGVTTIQPDSVTYDKIQDVSQAALLGSSNTSGGTVTEIPTIDLYLTTGSITTLLENTSNWDINGNYSGTTITGTYQGQNHYDGNYFFTAVVDNVWIRLIRG